jgi:hypothetical protein
MTNSVILRIKQDTKLIGCGRLNQQIDPCVNTWPLEPVYRLVARRVRRLLQLRPFGAA